MSPLQSTFTVSVIGVAIYSRAPRALHPVVRPSPVSITGVGRRVCSTRRAFTIATILSSILWASPARAQPDFSGLKVRPGDFVYVTDASGVVVGGPLTKLSPLVLTIDGHEFKPAPGLKIERLGDSLWNGTLIGMAVGAGLAAVAGGQGCASREDCPPIGAIVAGGVAFYGAVGAFIDWRIKGRTVVYEAPLVATPSVRVTPWLTTARKAVRVTVLF